MEPFNVGNQYCGLTIERCEVSQLPDAAWNDYERDGNKETLVKRHVGFFRSIFVPSLATALTDAGNSHGFADEMEKRLRRRLADQPAPYHSFTQTIAQLVRLLL
jgi:hypothetical protein